MPAVRPMLRAVGHGVPTAHGPKWADSCGSRWEQRVLLRPPVDEQLGRNALREVRESDHPMTTPDPLALAEEAERLARAATPGALTVERYDHGGGRMSVQDANRRHLVADTYHEGDRELFAVARDSMLTLAAALRAAHEENERLVTQAAELGKWRDAVLNAAVVDWTYRKEHETDPVRAVNDLVCYALDVEREALRKENQRLREATGGLVPPRWASLVEVSDEIAAELLAAPSRPVTVRLERRDDGRLEVLFQQHECTPTPDPLALAEENRRLREALRPFAHPDLREILSGNRCGGASIVFGRNKALLTINDFVRADAALAGGKGEG